MRERGRRLRRFLSVGLMVVGCVLLAGCTPGSRRASQPLRTSQVDLPPSYQFAPASIEVVRGTMITWTNHDNFTHSVQVEGQSEIHMMRPGESTQIRFDQPGTYPYVCTLHTQNMRGTVVVSDA